MNLFCKLFVLLLPCSIFLEASITNEGKISGGYVAEPNSNPYVVSLLTRYYRKRYRHCTGSILSERWILSSGNCVTDSRAKWYPWDAVVGAHNLEEVTSSMVYPISRRIAHPKYRGGVGPYDISMLKTSRDIEFSRKVRPIRLPISGFTVERNEDLLITGWGALERTYFVIVIPNKLREAEVSYLPFNDCYRAINDIKDSYKPNPLRKTHNICSGIPKTGSISGCTGDSGGPLVQYVMSTSLPTEPTETTTDRDKTTTTSTSTTTEFTMSPTPMTTDRTTTTQRTSSAIPMTTDRYTTTTQRTSSAIPMTTDRYTTTTQITSSAIPMTTDRTTITTPSISSPTPMTTDRSTTTDEITTPSLESISDMYQRLLFNRSSEVDYGNQRSVNNLQKFKVEIIPTVVGVVSWGIVPCGTRGAPTVYSNVSRYMDFINEYLYSV